MNILFVLPAYEPAWAFGGVVRSTSSLGRGLAALGHKVTVYTTNADGRGRVLNVPCGQRVDQGGVDTYYFPGTWGPQSVWDSRALVGRLRQTVGNFDLVYIAAIWQWLGIAAAAICGRRQVPLVIATRGSFDRVLRDRHRWRKTLYWHLFLKKSLSHAAALHFTTEYERRESQDLLAKFNSFIVVNGINCNYFHPVRESRDHFRQQYGIPSDAPLVITVGRADPKKRVDLLIRALQVTPEVHLLVVGPDSYNLIDTWKGLAQELGIKDRVFWTGLLQGEELLSAYSAADLFSLISIDENFANVVAEAMACGLPILINPEVGIWEEVGNRGVGIAVGHNQESIAGGFRDFVNNPGRWASYGENSVHVARELFSPDKVAALMAMAFQDVVANTRTAACRWQIARK